MGNAITILLAVLLLGCAIWALRRLKKGGGACSSCQGCAMAGECGKKERSKG